MNFHSLLKLVTIPLLLVSIVFHGQFAQGELIAPTTNNPSSTLVVDMDQDGDLDVLVSFSGENTLTWYENDGYGEFISAMDLPGEFKHCKKAIVLDIDGDGMFDVVAHSGDGVVWYQNYGDGLFAFPSVLYEIDGSIRSFEGVDVDLDGDVDLVWHSTGSGPDIGWLENVDNGTMGAVHSIDFNTAGGFMAVGNLNGDDLPDIAFRKSNPEALIVYLNNGDDGFMEMPSFESPDFPYPFGLTTADLNQDGLDDIIWFSQQASSWLKNMGENTYEIISLDETSMRFIQAVDVDMDGDLDLLGGYNRLKLLENIGNGEFETVEVLDGQVGGTISNDIGDLDGDGDLDVIASFNGADNIAWFEKSGSGLFDEKHNIWNSIGSPNFGVFTDLNGDEFEDLLYASQDRNSLGWLENVGDGTFYSEQVIVHNRLTGFTSACAQDLDGDGDVDIAACSPYGDSCVVWFPNVGGVFGEPVNISFSYCSISILSMDIDEDGDIDLVTNPGGQEFLVWFENNGEGEFSEGQVLVEGIPLLPDDSYTLVKGDLNSDGLDDLLFNMYDTFGGDWSSWGIGWAPNLGEGNFGEIEYLTTDLGKDDNPQIFDVDLDGELDIICASEAVQENSIAVCWYKNEGNGVFAIRENLALGANFPAILSDFDNDGDIDIVASSSVDYDVRFFQNNGNQVFVEEQQFFEYLYLTYNGQGVDIDNDGDIDPVMISTYSGKVIYFENLFQVLGCTAPGACNFADLANIDDGSCFFAPCYNLGDSNGDGEIDVQDLLDFLGNMGCTGECDGDLNGDGVINVFDLLILLGWMGINYP